MNVNEKICFIHGYLYRMAEEAKKDGLFEGYSIKEIVSLYLSEFIKDQPERKKCNGVL